MMPLRALAIAALAFTVPLLLGGCAVVSAIDTTAGLAVSTVGLAAGAAVGAVKITGKALGAAADAVIPGSAEENNH